MSWDVELTLMTRVLINDLDTTQSFTDGRIQQTLAVAARFVSEEIDLGQVYTVTIDASSGVISPDPTLTVTKDDIAVILFPLKAACIIDQNRLQGATANAIKIRDGDSEIDLSVGFKGFSDVFRMKTCHIL